jgi:hypothetical protein
MGNILLGALALAIAEGILSRSAATARVGGAVASIGKAVEWFVSPAVPAFKSAGASTSSSSLAVQTAALVGSGSVPPTPSSSPTTFPNASGIPFNQQSPQTKAQGGVV